MLTNHAEIRAKQRGVESQIIELLLKYGDSIPARHNAKIRVFNKTAIAKVKRKYGHDFVSKNHEKFRAYLVQARDNNNVITVGKRYSNLRQFFKN